MLNFKNIGWVSVEDVLNNPVPYISPSKNSGPVLLDPFEPDAKGRDYCARLYRGYQGSDLFIRSWMHGGTFYLLAPDVQEARVAAQLDANAANAMSFEDMLQAMQRAQDR
jgi:hypothetical protein